jgi:1,2-diacylglycerol 3-alpha-glucosyltransferase
MSDVLSLNAKELAMRILMASHGYPPTVSGVTLVVQKVARAMVKRGHEVTVITASEQGDPYRDEDEGVQLIRIRAAFNPFWKEAPIPFIGQTDLEEIVDEVRPDILHAHESAFLGMQVARLHDGADLPRVASCYYVPRFAARYLSWNDEPREVVESVVRFYSTWFYNHFDHVVFSTAAHRAYFASKDLTVATSIISNGIDTERYRPPGPESAVRDEAVEARYPLPPHPRILFVSRLARDKEIDVLIEAMLILWARHRAHLLLVGRGDDRKRLQALTHELDLEHCVHFLGFVPEADLPSIYRLSDLFAIASICEVQSLPTLQGAASGLPLVATDAVALPELVHDGVNGFLVEPGQPEALAEAIGSILGDPKLAAKMGRASLPIALEHAESCTFDRYEDLYQRTVSAAAGRLRHRAASARPVR